MRFISGDIEIPYEDFKIRESFNQLYSTIFLYSKIPVSGDVTVKGDGVQFETIVASIVSEVRGSRMTLIPKALANLIGLVPAPFQKEATTKEILEHYKVPYTIDDSKERQYWHIPSMNIESFLRFIKYKVNAGYAPVSTFTLAGYYLLVDLKARLAEKPEAVSFYNSFVHKMSIEWMFRSALNLEVSEHLLEGTAAKEISTSKKWGSGQVVKVITRSDLAPMFEKELYNKMGVVEYTTASLSIEAPNLLPALGACINLGKSKAVVTEVEISPNTIMLTASAPSIEV